MWVINGDKAYNMDHLKLVSKIVSDKIDSQSLAVVLFCRLFFYFDTLDKPSFTLLLENNLNIGAYISRIKMLEQDHNLISYDDFIEELNRIPGKL